MPCAKGNSSGILHLAIVPCPVGIKLEDAIIEKCWFFPTHGPETYLFPCFSELCSNSSKEVDVSRKLGDVFGCEHMVGTQFSVSHLRRSRSSKSCSQEDTLRRIWAWNQEEVGFSDQKRMRKQASECHWLPWLHRKLCLPDVRHPAMLMGPSIEMGENLVRKPCVP